MQVTAFSPFSTGNKHDFSTEHQALRYYRFIDRFKATINAHHCVHSSISLSRSAVALRFITASTCWAFDRDY